MNNFCFLNIALFLLYHAVLSSWWWWWVGGWVVVPRDYFGSTRLQFWLFCCWGCGYCWAVTTISLFERVSILVLDKTLVSNQSPMISSNFDFILSFDELVRVCRGSSWCIFQFSTNPRLISNIQVQADDWVFIEFRFSNHPHKAGHVSHSGKFQRSRIE